MKYHTTKSTFSHRCQQTGSTLIEVLVSMLILALGIMALMAMQVRTAASIKEAENMTIVSQATQNLVERISTNPILLLDSDNDTDADYTHYKIDSCKEESTTEEESTTTSTSTVPTPTVPSTLSDTNRGTLAKEQLVEFCTAMTSMQGVEQDNVRVSVCKKDTMEQGTFADLCTETSGNVVGDTVVKVAWKMETSDDEDADLDIDADGNITYFYQLPLIR